MKQSEWVTICVGLWRETQSRISFSRLPAGSVGGSHWRQSQILLCGKAHRTRRGGRWLVGIISRGTKDGTDSLFTSLYSHLGWLKELKAQAKKVKEL